MATQRIRFQEVWVKGVRRWVENGKRKQETKIFMQTINPFNKGEDGLPKSREQILEEIRHERDKWLNEAESFS